MKCFGAKFQLDAALKVGADTSELYFRKSGGDPTVGSGDEGEEEEPVPARTRTAAAPTVADLSGQRLLAPDDCLPASFNGKACYFRLDKKAKKTDTWTVGVCNKGTADTAGEKPRASGGVHKMTTAEIRAALVVEEVE